MKSAKINNTNNFVNLAVVHLIAIFLVIISIYDVRIGAFFNIMPLFSLMIIFYFSVFNKIFDSWFIFTLGIWLDAINSNYLGLTSLCYILVIKSFIMFNGKNFIAKNFQQIWQQFALFCLSFLSLKYLFISALLGYFMPIINIIFQLIISCLLYVFMHRFCDFLSKKLLEIK